VIGRQITQYRIEAQIGESGTPYRRNIAANFSTDSGSGKRVEGRACSVTFSGKQ
jgi:hypothetical protein